MNVDLRKRALRWAMAFLACGFMGGCGWNDQAMGGGGDATETGNARVAGHLVLEDGHPAEGAQVIILASNYNPVRDPSIPDSQQVLTDVKGLFKFEKLDSGEYNIQVRHPVTHTCLLIYNIKVALEKVRVPEDTLRLPGGLSVPIPETQDSGSGYVYVPGTTFKGRVDSEIRIAGKILIDSMPPGSIPSVVYSKGDTGSKVLVLAARVPVREGAVTLVPPFVDWSHSRKVALNTSSTGTLLAKDLYGFPMLVRLTAPDFDFSQAQADGSDLRFSRPDGTPLIREIEAWDAKAGHAEIWVRMDTVRAGDANQAITMHWGNSKAAAPKAALPVFDTAAGFAGVWHLGEEAKDTTANGIYRDATHSGDDGNDRVTNTRQAGLIAGGHGFDSADYIEAPIASRSAANPNAFSLSIWYRSNGTHMSAGGEMLSMGDNFGLRLYADGTVHLFFWPPTPPAGLTSDWWQVHAQKPEYVDGNWHLAAGVFSGTTLRLYVDGKEVGNAAVLGPVAYMFPLNATMGKHGNHKTGFEFAGDLDEAEIHSAARSPEWMGLTYANQKANAAFPTLVKP